MTESTHAAVAAGVRAVIAAHAQAQDAGRTDDVVALYAPDGVLELPGAEPVKGHDALRAAFAGWQPTRPQLHLTGNTVVTVQGVDEATAVSDVTFFHRGDGEPGAPGWTVRIVGRYEDTLRRYDGAWRLTRRSSAFQA
ncbi:nuclear transport factor 2 family protein [Streptomyces paludis]|uniref:Nuclear transport factor 2 family protein n=1 Tax=Streptomyces paludis TaxID=2282738 RepID=A0A345HXM2_9ACTN|nr:nuclear transport factor 2 family protein [Streptomyces paludis]AXG81446.1 nuclear transport factor 2 family protein [Streptomyces paludis]